MTEIKTELINGKYEAKCPYCGKLFSYPYIGQTKNNVESHAKYCKYKPRDDIPHVVNTELPPPPPPPTPSIDTELYKKYEVFYNKYSQMIAELQGEKVLP